MNNTLKKCLYSFLLLLASLIASHSAFGQNLTIHPTFNNMYGGGFFEDLYASFETSDGGFILGGKAFQNAITGNINDPFCGVSNSDYWIVKTDIDGNTEWDTLFGGSANEELYDMIETSDGGYALVGRSTSPASCDVPAGNPFVYDAWVVKIDALGNILWTSRFGSTQGDNAKSIIETSDGGLLIGGDTMNIVDNAPDYWITKLDGTTGAILWDNSIGGDNFDFLEIVRETTDGFFLGGYSISGISKDKMTANFGSWDYWVIKVDLNGNYVWDISYGGSGNDQLWDMEVTSDGGLIIGGFSDSDPSVLPNNKTAPNIGGEDSWAIKVNSAGAITWDRSYGGVDLDRIYSVEVIDLTDCVANYIFGGLTQSGANGDVTDPNIGAGDYWINFVDANGDLIWEKNYGGDQYEEARDFRRNSDGSYIIGGYTISDNNGDVPSTNYGAFDNWVLKLSCNFDIPDLVDEEVCEGETITLTAVTGTCDNCSYQWDANGGNANTNSITVSPNDTTTYTVIVTNATCCSDTTSTTIIWHPSPTIDLGPDADICPSESISLDATTPTCAYAWSTAETTPIINPTMAGSYSVTITCEFGCTNSDEIILSPGTPPIVNLGNNTTLCEGDSLLLDAGTGGMNYNWSTGATTQMIYGNDETDYCVTVTSVGGCTAVDCISINYDTVQVVLPNDTMLCLAETLVVSAGNIGCTYNWSNGSTSQSIAISTAGTYTVTVTCGPTSCTTVDEIIVGYFSLNSPQNVSVDICQGDSLFVGGAWQFITGNYSDTYLTAGGCDSIVNTNLMVHPISSQNIPIVICQGETYFAQGAAQNITGTYFDTLSTVDGCDSIIITDLIVNSTFSQNIPIEICQGENYFAGGAPQTMTGSYPDTLMTVDGCDSIIITDLVVNPVFSQNVDTEICQGDSTFVGGNWQIDSGSYPDTLATINGCDSIIITDLIVNDTFEIMIDSMTCNSAIVGLDTIYLFSQNGCDSNVIYNFILIDIDTFIFEVFTCDSNLVDTTFANATGVNGECDSTFVNIISLAPIYEINIDTTTCIASQVGLDTVYMSSVFGCDSNLIYDYQLIDTDSFFFQNFTCDSNMIDTTFANATGMNGECDSILINIISLAPSYEINIDTTTCITSQVGLDTVYMTSQFNCDSTIIFNYALLAVDTFLMSETTCDSSFIGMTTTNLPGINGECDSILIINTTFACDTIYTNSTSCNPLDTGVFIQINGGNTIIDSISLASPDSTFLTDNSCNPLDTGLVLTSTLQNIFGCDSLVFTYTTFPPFQNVLIESTTCDANLVGIFIDSLQNQFGCDSIITNSISFSPPSIDTILTLTCFFNDIGTDTLFVGTNSLGCDSLVLAITTLEQVMEAFISFSDITCFGESDGVILIDSVMGGTPPFMYSLDNMPFQSSPNFTNLSADNYTILIEDADGCQTLAVISLNSTNEVIVDLGADLFINIGDSVSIFAQINIDIQELDTIIWTTVDSINCIGDCIDFTVTPFQTTTYSIIVIDENGCSAQDEITVQVDEYIPVYIPNAFSPNGDTQNDKITIFGNTELIDEVQTFKIFDRWGELVYLEENFQPNDPGSGWDGNLNGKPVNPAVFVYFAEVKFIDGSIKQFKGDITLTR